MQASAKEVEALKNIQKFDCKIKEIQKAYDSMPEKDTINDLIKKSSELQAKCLKAKQMKNDAIKRYEKITTEDVRLSDREINLQKDIEAAGTDFRNLEVRTKELEGISRRRTVLAEMALRITEELDKAKVIIEKLEDAISAFNSKIESLKAKVEDRKNLSEAEITEILKCRKSDADKLSPELAELYDRACARLGNVVLSHLEDNRCSACRTEIEEGRLLEIKSEGRVGVCPHCSRILLL